MKLGIDRLADYQDLFKGKRVGLITNPTGITSSRVSSIDYLKDAVDLVALYSPEHGIRGALQAGVAYESEVDKQSGLTAYSLYGDHRHPSREMMDMIDIMAIDIQDGGSRFYTFIYSMAYAMMSAAEYDKTFVVFDRPNPAGCDLFEGNILDLSCRSFIGYYPIVQRHGMTIGELATLFNEEYGIHCRLVVIPMEGYTRTMTFEETKALWIAPSPNFPTVMTALVYNATCIFEGTNVAEGRGTTAPFQYIGAPWIDPFLLSDRLNGFNYPGVFFRPMYFTPTFSKYVNTLCGGVEVHVLDRQSFRPVKVGWTMLDVIRHAWPDDYQTNKPYREGAKCMLELNTGCTYIKDDLYPLPEQLSRIEHDTALFGETRKKYLLY